MPFAARVAASRPVHFLDAEELARDDEPTVERLAARCVEAILDLDPSGPYLLSGHCFGGIVSYEVARQLTAAGRQVATLALFDTPMPGYPHPARDFGACVRGAGYFIWRSVHTRAPLSMAASVLGSLGRHARRLVQGRLEQSVRLPGPSSSARMLWRYRPGPYAGAVHQLIASANPQTGTPVDRRLGWRRLVASFDVSRIDANHYTMFDADHVDEVARFLVRALAGAPGDAHGSVSVPGSTAVGEARAVPA
jgi:phthiocerol/phenolphthiocerol synthesis type-I polyketide synthase D